MFLRHIQDPFAAVTMGITLLNRPNAMMKKALLWDENRNQIEPRTRFLQFYVKTKKVCRCFANFSSEQENFTHGMYITALSRASDVKNRTDHVLWRNDAKVYRRSIAFAIAVVVTSRYSSFEYTMSVHAVHAGAERNVCTIVVSTETPQTTTNPSQTLLPVYKLAHLPLPHSKSSPPRTNNLQPLAQTFYADALQI